MKSLVQNGHLWGSSSLWILQCHQRDARICQFLTTNFTSHEGFAGRVCWNHKVCAVIFLLFKKIIVFFFLPCYSFWYLWMLKSSDNLPRCKKVIKLFSFISNFSQMSPFFMGQYGYVWQKMLTKAEKHEGHSKFSLILMFPLLYDTHLFIFSGYCLRRKSRCNLWQPVRLVELGDHRFGNGKTFGFQKRL